MEFKAIRKELYGETYYNVFYNNNWFDIKEKDIKLFLGVKKVCESTIKKYMKQYY